MTRVLITGAAGFLGRRLTRALLDAGSLTARDGTRQAITELCLADLAPVTSPRDGDIAVTTAQGDLADPAFVASLVDGGFDSIFHLASYLTLHAETDPAHAFAVNVEALRRLLDGAGNTPKLVFASSIAVFGGALPDRVGDDLAPMPTTTYGIHKAICELLIADYARHGRVDGRALRLPIVLVRPGAPQPVVSDRVAAILREPLDGHDVVAPLAADTLVPVISVGAVVRALIGMHDLPAEKLPLKRAFNLPALTVSVADLADAAARRGATGRVRFDPDPQMQAIVAGWPTWFVSDTADALGLAPDTDLDAVIDDYLAHRDGG